MKRLTSFIFLILLFVKFSFSQSHDLSVRREGGKLYLIHTVVAKENWYSVGRIYNISPKEIAPFNSVTIEKPLSIGQEVKIPLTNINFSQEGKKNADETFVPVYHIAESNEMLSHISANHNKVPIENLEKWNRIKKDGVKDGMHIVVGYIKVKTALSLLASGSEKNIKAAPEIKEEEKNLADNTAAIKEEKKPAPVIDKPEPPKKEVKATTAPPPVNENKAVLTNNKSGGHFSGSYFGNEYNEGNNKLNGLAGTFKSTSGWNDGKFYVLINNIPVGTIVKVIAPATQKSVYAKVLGQLPDMKESEGLLVRISNSASNELGEGEGKFNVQVKY